MARPRVRHCTECPEAQISQSRFWRGQRICKCRRAGKYINGQEIRNSPKWCPLGRTLKQQTS